MNKKLLKDFKGYKYSEHLAILQLINRHFWKSKIGPISSLAIPLFLMAIYKILSKNQEEIFTSGLPAYFSFSILPLSLISLPQMLVEFKTSIILRKISTSRISSSNFITILLFYNFCAILISNFIIILLTLIFLNKNAVEYFKNINFGELIYALINIYLSALTLGLILGIFINKIGLVQSLGFSIIIISITFSGQFIPIQVLNRSSVVNYISLISPITYSLNQLNVVLLPDNRKIILELNEIIGHLPDLDQQFQELEKYTHTGSLFDVKNVFNIFDFSVLEFINETTGKPEAIISKITITPIYQPWQSILNLVMPYVISISFILISIKNFKWTSR